MLIVAIRFEKANVAVDDLNRQYMALQRRFEPLALSLCLGETQRVTLIHLHAAVQLPRSHPMHFADSPP